MQSTTFGKRIYTLPTFLAGVRDQLAHLEDLRVAVRRRRVRRTLAEKIMLAVTQVNGCRYCSYAHTRLALRAGVDEAELRSLLAGELDSLPESELVALAFAQHYAEGDGRPDEAAWQRLVDFYGPAAARDILAYTRMITIANLLGNTFDALLSRLQGRSAPGSSFLSELLVLLLAMASVPVATAWGAALAVRAAFGGPCL